MESPSRNDAAKAVYPVLTLDSEITPLKTANATAPRQWQNKLKLALKVTERVLIKPFRYDFFSQTLSGKGRRSDEQLRVKYIGEGTHLHYLKELCFEENVNAGNPNKLSLLSLPKAIRDDRDCDLLLVDLPMPLNMLLQLPGRFTPHWVKQNIALPETWEAFLGTLRRKTRMEAQRIIRKFGLQSRIVPAEDCAADFYDKLYKPYTLARHGESTVIDSQAEFVASAKGSYIMQLLRDGEVVAGSQIRQSGDSFSIGAVGMDLSLPYKDQMCLIDAMDYFALMHALQLGCSHVDMGHSRANLNDGILRYKKKWGADIRCGVIPKGSFSFKAMNTSPAVLDFYSHNLLISQNKRELCALKLLRHDDDSSKLPAQLQQMQIQGLHRIQILLPTAMRGDISDVEQCNLQCYDDDAHLLRLLNS